MTALPTFANEPVLELRRAPVRESLTGALAHLDARLPLRVPVLIGAERGRETGLHSTDPGKPDRVVAEAGLAGDDDAAAAVGAASTASGSGVRAAQPSARRRWSARPPRYASAGSSSRR